MAKDLAIVLNNGSINSAVTTALAAQKYRPILVHAEVIKHDKPTRRKSAYDAQVGHFKPFREHTIPMPYLTMSQDKSLSGSVSNDPRIAEPILPALRELVPLLGAALTIAVAYEASSIYIGLRVGPSTDELAQATEFVQIWNEMFQLTLGRPELELMAPLLELEPWQVIDLGYQVNAPLDRTWSCIEEHADACGSCRGCRQRESSFMQAAKADPSGAVKR
ncbi:MAG: 7-cyano-7-deazaguanine synthase [Burkholderiales bacterium]|nr:7-cyano-7-deazaguanine synthase [Phycisphaerae bacterium]